jgi:hypothetical protein
MVLYANTESEFFNIKEHRLTGIDSAWRAETTTLFLFDS